MAKKLLILFALFIPAYGLIFFKLQPQFDLTVSVPLFHFYIVTFTTFSAAVISLLLVSSLGAEARPRHILAAAAFAVIGGVFFSHGLATPNALIDHAHPAVSWSAWLTLFGGGVLFAIAGLDGANGLPRWISVRAVIYCAVGGVLIYSGVAAFAPQLLDLIETSFVAPWHRTAIFWISLLLWLFAAFRLWRIWLVSRNRVDGVRLARYYLAASLILTALLALAASALFTQFAYNTLVSEIQTSSTNIAQNLGSSLTSDMADVSTAEHVRQLNSRSGSKRLLSLRMTGLPLHSVVIYGSDGVASQSSISELVGVKAEDRSAFEQALNGKAAVVIREPNPAAATAYGPSSSVSVVATYVPLHPGGKMEGETIGVLTTLQEVPTLNTSIITARVTGLVIAALSMGLLFVALLSVVGRADRIITIRTDELRKLSAQLKTYSEWFFGKDLLEKVLADSNVLSLARRERTVMFMDIRGFTAWSESRSPEEVVGMLNRYYHASEMIFKQHGAIKFKFSADEAMAVFAHAGQATIAALNLRDSVKNLLANSDLGAGIGLHTGPLVEGLLGSDEAKFYDVIGDTVNTAKRIEGNATRAEVLASDDTCKALDSKFSIGQARQVAAKGKGELTVHPLERKS
ncbi:MAG: adenylate/guanylate cyclase domain-containing protein [Chloroflexi bacterium]|nr:adenylate/guanylate cyclase domain-containing protein [Chloroflexota bacterium]